MLIRHSVVYIAAKLLPGALGMVTTALLTRSLPPEQYGLYGIALVIMSLGATLVFEWLGLAYLRFARGQTDPALAVGTFVQLFRALLVLTVLAGAVAVIVLPRGERAIVAAGLVLMASYASFEFRARFHVAGLAPQAYLRMNVSRAALILLAASAASWLTREPVWTVLATASATFAGSYAGGRRPSGKGFDPALARDVLRFGVPLAASLALSSATGSLTRGLVGALGSIEALGLYTAAFVLVQNTLVVLSSGLASAGFSLAVHALETGNAAAARRQLAANGALLLAVLAPASLGMALTADSLAATLVGPDFRAAVAVLTPWMAAGAFLSGFRSHYLDHAFQLGHRMSGQIWVTASAAAVTLGLDALLIPRMGPRGAAIAVTAGAAVAVVHAVAAGRKAFAIPLPLAPAIRVGGACALMTVTVLAVPGTGPAALAGKIGAGTLTYAAAALALDVIGLRTQLVRRLRRVGPLAGPAA